MTSNLQKTIENIFRLKGILYAVHDSRVYVTDISEAEDQLVNIGFGLDDYATCYMKDKHKVHFNGVADGEMALGDVSIGTNFKLRAANKSIVDTAYCYVNKDASGPVVYVYVENYSNDVTLKALGSRCKWNKDNIKFMENYVNKLKLPSVYEVSFPEGDYVTCKIHFPITAGGCFDFNLKGRHLGA